MRLALQLQRRQWLDQDSVAYESLGLLSHQNLAGTCSTLQPLRDRDRMTGREGMAPRRIAGDDLAGVDPGAQAELEAVLAAQVLVQSADRLPELHRCANGAERVVLVQRRNAEHRHDRVADELLDRTAVPSMTRLTSTKYREIVPVRLRVEVLAQRCRVDDVAEDDGHRPASFARNGAVGFESRAACEAEPGLDRVLLATAGTGGHVLVSMERPSL